MTYDSRPPRHRATMPSAIHLGLRRPGIRGGSGVAAGVVGAAGAAGLRLLARWRPVALRGSMSMVMVVVPGVAGWGWGRAGWSSGLPGGHDVGLGSSGAGHGIDADHREQDRGLGGLGTDLDHAGPDGDRAGDT